MRPDRRRAARHPRGRRGGGGRGGPVGAHRVSQSCRRRAAGRDARPRRRAGHRRPTCCPAGACSPENHRDRSSSGMPTAGGGRALNSTAVAERGRPRLAISSIEDITDIKRAEEAQRFLAESSRVLASSLDLDETLSRVERLAASWIGGDWTIDVRPVSAAPPRRRPTTRCTCRSGCAQAWPARSGCRARRSARWRRPWPRTSLCAWARRSTWHASIAAEPVIAQTLQATLLPPVPPQIAGLETAGLYRPAAARAGARRRLLRRVLDRAARVVSGQRLPPRLGRRGVGRERAGAHARSARRRCSTAPRPKSSPRSTT